MYWWHYKQTILYLYLSVLECRWHMTWPEMRAVWKLERGKKTSKLLVPDNQALQLVSLPKTRFQLILPVQSQNVTKNRTDHRMHVEGIQICQINGWNNSFQNMCNKNRQKLTVWPGKLILCKKTPQKRLFLCARIWVTWLWNDLDAKPLTPAEVALKILGYNASN